MKLFSGVLRLLCVVEVTHVEVTHVVEVTHSIHMLKFIEMYSKKQVNFPEFKLKEYWWDAAKAEISKKF